MKAFITGITGFAGSHLAEHLLLLGHEVAGLARPGAGVENLDKVLSRISLHEGDILAPETLSRIIREAQPDWVFHLAGQSSVSISWENPALTLSANALGGVHLLDACLPLKDKIRIIAAGSVQIFGRTNPSEVLTENSPYAPEDPYATSKLTFDLLARQYCLKHGLELVLLRFANHTGPRQAPNAVVADFAKQVAEIEAGLKEPVIQAGNLDSHRDFTDVRDVVKAYALAAESAEPGEAYLVCSGVSLRIGDVLDILLSLARVPIRVARDPAKYRPADPGQNAISAAKFTAATGWRTEIPIETTLRDTLDFWRCRIGEGSSS